MRRVTTIILSILLVLLLLLAIVPFLVPVRPLENVRPPTELGYADSRFVEVPLGSDTLTVHVQEQGPAGEADGPPLILLHGFAASTFSWRNVMPALADSRRVVAYDRPAQGLTERPMRETWGNAADWETLNPFGTEGQMAMLNNLMDTLGIESAVLVGNSAGGTLATRMALEHPERVAGLVLISPAVYAGGGAPGWVRPLFNLPQVNRLAPLLTRRIQQWGMDFARTAWHDPSRMTDADWEGYLRPLQAQDWDRGLWELSRASSAADFTGRLGELTVPTLVITGDDDRVVPTAQSVRLAGELPDASLTVISACGHVAQEECPGETLAAIDAYLAELPTSTTENP